MAGNFLPGENSVPHLPKGSHTTVGMENMLEAYFPDPKWARTTPHMMTPPKVKSASWRLALTGER